jgi:hypothetical protein
LDASADVCRTNGIRDLRRLVHAWELVNEPELALGGPITQTAMVRFIEAGARLIRTAGFDCTVGFQHATTQASWWPTPLGDITLPQFHYYGDAGGLPANDPAHPRILGEIATRDAGPATGAGAGADPWPAPTPANTLEERLRVTVRQHYSLVFLWSMRAHLDVHGHPVLSDPRSAWAAEPAGAHAPMTRSAPSVIASYLAGAFGHP